MSAMSSLTEYPPTPGRTLDRDATTSSAKPPRALAVIPMNNAGSDNGNVGLPLNTLIPLSSNFCLILTSPSPFGSQRVSR